MLLNNNNADDIECKEKIKWNQKLVTQSEKKE